MKKISKVSLYSMLVLALMFGLMALPASAADHLDAPGLTPPGGDTRVDITDVYAFQSPANPDNTVLVMGVNPLEGVLNDGTFRPAAYYEFKIDSTGDGNEDLTYRVTFSKPNGSLQQKLTLKALPAMKGATTMVKGMTGTNIAIPGGGWISAGAYDDPFFFDLNGFLALDFCNPGTNFFNGLNISAIVLEVPSSWLGSNNIGVWARTVVNNSQIDRMGRPAINTVFIPNNPLEPSGSEPSQRNAFNAGKPSNDQRDFRGEVVDTLEIFYGAGSPAAQGLADFLLPDVLTIDTSSSAGFPNGRALADDVIDIELGLVTNGAITSDCVANDSAFSSSFPYLAPEN
ncbi:MAG TPA: DUF4331 family protein [Anaerolineales bacterium]|nr:DUF4331 family protein [Anaerolineales bacterium]